MKSKIEPIIFNPIELERDILNLASRTFGVNKETMLEYSRITNRKLGDMDLKDMSNKELHISLFFLERRIKLKYLINKIKK